MSSSFSYDTCAPSADRTEIAEAWIEHIIDEKFNKTVDTLEHILDQLEDARCKLLDLRNHKRDINFAKMQCSLEQANDGASSALQICCDTLTRAGIEDVIESPEMPPELAAYFASINYDPTRSDNHCPRALDRESSPLVIANELQAPMMTDDDLMALLEM